MKPNHPPFNKHADSAFQNALRGFPGGYTHSFGSLNQTQASWPQWQAYLDSLLAELLNNYRQADHVAPGQRWQHASQCSQESIAQQQDKIAQLMSMDIGLQENVQAWIQNIVLPHFCNTEQWQHLVDQSYDLLCAFQRCATELVEKTSIIPMHALTRFTTVVESKIAQDQAFEHLHEVQKAWYHCWDQASSETMQQPQVKRLKHEIIEISIESNRLFNDFQQLGWNEMGLITKNQWESVQQENERLQRYQKQMQEEMDTLNERLSNLEYMMNFFSAKRA